MISEKKLPMKPTAAELEIRYSKVAKLIASGYSYQDILRFVSTNYDVSSRTCDNYIKEARKRIKRSTEADISDFRAIIVMRYEKLYKIANEQNDLRECRRLLADMSKLHFNSTIQQAVVEPKTLVLRVAKNE